MLMLLVPTKVIFTLLLLNIPPARLELLIDPLAAFFILLIFGGTIFRQRVMAIQQTYDAMPNPQIAIAIGNGACTGIPYRNTDACLKQVDAFLPADFYIPGDPPFPVTTFKDYSNVKTTFRKVVTANA